MAPENWHIQWRRACGAVAFAPGMTRRHLLSIAASWAMAPLKLGRLICLPGWWTPRRSLQNMSSAFTDTDRSTAIKLQQRISPDRRIEMLTENLAIHSASREAQRPWMGARTSAYAAPVLISEREVIFGTRVRWGTTDHPETVVVEAVDGLRAALQRSLAPPAQEGRPVRRDYPKRYTLKERLRGARRWIAFDVREGLHCPAQAIWAVCWVCCS